MLQEQREMSWHRAEVVRNENSPLRRRSGEHFNIGQTGEICSMCGQKVYVGLSTKTSRYDRVI